MKAEEWAGRTLANGGTVASTSGAPTNLDVSNGGTMDGIHYRKAVKLVLEDGDVVYGCTWAGCDYVSSSAHGVVAGHHKVHVPQERRLKATKVVVGDYGNWTLEQILGRLTDLEKDWEKYTERHAIQLERLTNLKLTAQEDLREARIQIRNLEQELRELKSLGQRFFAAATQ